MVSMNSWMLSMKVVLISAGVASVAMAIKSSVPIAVEGIPAVWSSVVSWMKPPYLYIIINGIIITIAASTRFHHSKSEAPAARSEHYVSVKTPPPSRFASFSAQAYIPCSTVEESIAVDAAVPVVAEIEESTAGELTSMVVSNPNADAETEKEILVESEPADILVDSLPEENIVQLENLLPIREKPLVSSRFGHRKPIRSNPEVSGARALRVARSKRHDTLESTWKTITEGRHVPLTRHLKKPDAWEHVPKSETFKERVNSTARIRKEASLGQDELNRRVEAFIKKFNEDMRMQRQESINQFMEMINRGV